jgi:hypothetical protein
MKRLYGLPSSRPSYNRLMRDSYAGPAMTLGNMRALGVQAITLTFECGRESIVDACGWPDSVEIPALRWRLKCTSG